MLLRIEKAVWPTLISMWHVLYGLSMVGEMNHEYHKSR